MLNNAPKCTECGKFMPWDRYKEKYVFGPCYWNGPDAIEEGICERCERKMSSDANVENKPTRG